MSNTSMSGACGIFIVGFVKGSTNVSLTALSTVALCFWLAGTTSKGENLQKNRTVRVRCNGLET